MMTKETLTNVATAVFLSDIIDLIPMKSKIKRKTIEGIINRELPMREKVKLDITQYLNFNNNNEIISWFIKTLEERFSYCDLTSLYKNIKSLKVEDKDRTILERLDEIIRMDSGASGTYSPRKNKIRIYPSTHYSQEEADYTKMHELVHFATTRKEKNITLCGFEQTQNKVSFATGLNEGYTEWFTRRYILKTNGGSYEKLQTIAAGIEALVGEKKMHQYFFSNDLNGLIKDMEQYTTREQALALIEKIDKIYHCGGKVGVKKYKEKLEREARVDVANMLIARNKKLLAEGIIPEENYKNSLFALELYAHDCKMKLFGTEKEITEILVVDYIDENQKITIPFEEYSVLRNEYYEEKKDNQSFQYIPWKNKDGLTLDELFTEIEAKRRKTELNEMFQEQSPSFSNKTQSPKKW